MTIPISLAQNTPGGIKHLTNKIRTGKNLPRDTAEALESIHTVFQGLGTDLAGAFITIPDSSANLQPLDFTLDHTTVMTITAPGPTLPGDRITIFLLQDSSGFCQIGWDTMFKFASINLDPTPNTWSVYDFCARVDPTDTILKWFACSLPLTGMS